MLKISKILALFLIVGFILSCDPVKPTSADCHHQITIKNNSDSLIFHTYCGVLDTTLSCRGYFSAAKILPNEYVVWDIRPCWEGEINYHGGFKFIFLNSPSNSADDCDSVELNSLIISEKIYTVDDLNASDWIVEYP